MSLSTFFKLVGKAYRFSVRRPMQRFNIYNRVQNHLGPEAKYFKPAPRRALADGTPKVPLIEPQSPDQNKQLLENSSQLRIVKTLEAPPPIKALESGSPEEDANLPEKDARPLPVCRNLPLQNQASIWQVDKVPPGRLSLDMMSDLLLKQLEDADQWTPERVSQHFGIKEDYAASLIGHLKHIQILVSPRMAKNLDYISRENPQYQASKHLVYIVDNSLRTEMDRKYDDMFEPTDQLDEKVRKVIEKPAVPATVAGEQKAVLDEKKPANKLIRKPKPLSLEEATKNP